VTQPSDDPASEVPASVGNAMGLAGTLNMGLAGSSAFKDVMGLAGSSAFKDVMGLAGSSALKDVMGLAGSSALKDVMGLAGSSAFKDVMGLAGRVMQNPAIASQLIATRNLAVSWRHAVSNNRQRLLWPIERRFPRPNLSRRRSRCGSSVCQDWTKSNSANLNTA
jgi:hypothetical protein